MPYEVGHRAAVVNGDDIYVIDGSNVNTVIRYRNGKLLTLTPLLNNPDCHIVVLDNNCICVYGGDNRTGSEFYNISTGQWSVVDNAIYESIKT